VGIIPSLIVSAGIAYLLAGYELVPIGAELEGVDRPLYEGEDLRVRLSVMLLWPRVARSNQSFGFTSAFALSYFIWFFALLHFDHSDFPAWLVVIGVLIVRLVPGVKMLVTLPVGLVAMTLFFVSMRPFGARNPW
jgi:hypothetical protein